MRQLNREFRRRAEIEGIDLTMAQLSLLRILEAHGTLRPVDLAHQAGLSASTITGILDRLEADGLVQRLRRQADRREIDVQLSDAGAVLLSDVQGSVFEGLVELFAPLSDEEIATLQTIVGKLVRR